MIPAQKKPQLSQGREPAPETMASFPTSVWAITGVWAGVGLPLFKDMQSQNVAGFTVIYREY